MKSMKFCIMYFVLIISISCNQPTTNTPEKPKPDTCDAKLKSVTRVDTTDSVDIELYYSYVYDSVNNFELIRTNYLTEEEMDSIMSNYNNILRNIDNRRNLFATRYCDTIANSERAEVISEARVFLMSALVRDVFPAWYGTVWDYNGYTNKPQDGEIACGYFVSTTLKHIGVNLNRYHVAQQYSHKIISTLCLDDSIKVISEDRFSDMLDGILQLSDDIYIVGLDSHVGFLAKYDNAIHFVHSNYMGNGVESEPAESSDALAASSVYVYGSLFKGDKLIIKWLTGEKVVLN